MGQVNLSIPILRLILGLLMTTEMIVHLHFSLALLAQPWWDVPKTQILKSSSNGQRIRTMEISLSIPFTSS